MKGSAQDVKDKIDVAEFIKQYVQLLPAGRNLKGLCPFHGEKTPSFIVSPEKQIWHCFGCGAGGDVIKFLMQYENIEFFEALKILAEKAGIKLQGRGGDQGRFNILYDINRAAKNFFYSNLKDTEGGVEANQYLKKRGLSDRTIEEFELGFASRSHDALGRSLVKAGFSMQDIERAGLVLKTQTGTYRDRFRERVMFPLHNSFGKCVGFTGRLMPSVQNDQLPKYVNSPETPIFNKSKILFGFHKSKEAIREKQRAILVEGQMDFLALWEKGIQNVVASSGTAFTREHLRLLKRFVESVVIAFDNDEAGRVAAERTVDLAQSEDLEVFILEYERIKGEAQKQAIKDPADLVMASLDNARELLMVSPARAMDYYIRNRDTKEKKELRNLLGKIKNIHSPTERSVWMKKLSTKTGFTESVLEEEMSHVEITPSAAEVVHAEAPDYTKNFSKKDLLTQRLISIGLVFDRWEKILEGKKSFHDPYNMILDRLHQKKDIEDNLKSLANYILMRSPLDVAYLSDEAVDREIEHLFLELRREHLKTERNQARQKIQSAETEGDDTMLMQALQEFDRLSKEMQNI